MLAEKDSLDELATVLDRAIQTCALAAFLGEEGLATEAIRALVAIYDHGFDRNGFARHDTQPPTSKLWQMVIERIFAAGGVAVRQHRWGQVRALAVQKGRGDDFRFYGSWLRHGLVMAARAGHLDVRNEQGRQISLSLMLLAQGHAQQLPALRLDLAADDDDLLSSICQFDLLAALAAIDDSDDLDDRSWYTNFARFDWSRAEPALERLITDSDARAAVFPRSDAELAEAVQQISGQAKSETFRYMVFSRWQSPSVVELLTQHGRLQF